MSGSDHCYFFECGNDRNVDVSAASNNDLKLGETRTVQVVCLVVLRE